MLISIHLNGQVNYKNRISNFLSNSDQLKSNQAEYEFIITDQNTDQRSGITHVYIQHTKEGKPILGNVSGFHFDKVSNLAYTGLRLPSLKFKVKKQNIKIQSFHQALSVAAQILGLPATFDLEKTTNTNKQSYHASNLSSQDIFIREAFQELKKELIPVWEIGIYDDAQHKWQVLIIDSSTGKELKRGSWTNECFSSGNSGSSPHKNTTHQHHHDHHDHHNHPSESTASCENTYSVYAHPLVAPNEGSQTEVTAPWLSAPIASPNGWHDANFLRGNNAHAVEDADANNNAGYSTDGGQQLCFDAIFDDTQDIQQNIDVSLANAFYWNNIIHDVMYNYGFDEASGNFQQSNFNRGGLDNDRINVDIQDGSGSNNANFSSPPDGFSGRMQMFEWTPVLGNKFEIIESGITSQEYNHLPAQFGPKNISITDTIVIGNPNNACDDMVNESDLLGKIALIDRGDCTFSEKAIEIQQAGAVAMIVCNEANSNLFRMDGEPSVSITIPSILISKANCDSLKVKLNTTVVEGKITVAATFDSALDNGIVTHEYGHGISTRLTGGPSSSSCLFGNEQMGEGWSDWYALMFSLDESDNAADPKGVGAYVLGQNSQGGGIRNFPYSTDLGVNPVTYNNIKFFSIPHGVGSVWASMLWDMTWNLIDEHGFDSDIYNGTGGNNMAMSIVTLGLKLQPCDPGFVDGRDAILAADEILYNGANACLIWKAFSRRGLGINADQGSSVSVTDGVQNFDMPEHCELPFIYNVQTENYACYGDTISFYFDIRTNEREIDTALIRAQLSHEINYQSGVYSSLNNDVITIQETELDSHTFSRNIISAMLSPEDSSKIYYLERAESSSLTWQILSDTGSQNWEVSNFYPYADSLSFFCKNVSGDQTQILQSPPFYIKNPNLLGFWHYYNLEKNWDGGFVELSIDNGSTWIDIGVDAIENGYNELLKHGSNTYSEGRLAYSGSNDEYQQTIIDLTPYVGETVLIRFVLASDQYAYEEGWYIDNISLYHKYSIDLYSKLDAGDNAFLLDTTSVVIVPTCEPCEKDYCDSMTSSITVITQDVYQASQFLESNASLSGLDDVQFMAGDSILLKKEFTVAKDASFEAIIDHCIEP